MSYYTNSNATVAVTNAATAPVALACNSSLPLNIQPTDLIVTASPSSANVTVGKVLDVTSGLQQDISTFVVEINLGAAFEVRPSLNLE